MMETSDKLAFLDMCVFSDRDPVKPTASAEVAGFNAAGIGTRSVRACRQSAAVDVSLCDCRQTTEQA